MTSENGTAYRLGHLESQVEHLDSEVDQLRQVAVRADERLARLAEDVKAIRSASEKQNEQDRVTLRWRIGTTLAVVMAILAAAAIVVQGLQ